MTETHEANDMQAPHVRWTKYVIVAVILAIITAIEVTLALGHFLLPALTTVMLIVLTLTKAGMVMAFYMHLKYDTRWYTVVLIFPLFMVVILFSVVLINAANWNII